MPRDDVPCRMFTLLVELLRVPDRMPPLAVAGAWGAARLCAYKREAVAPLALDLGLFDLAATHLRALGSASDWVVSPDRHWVGMRETTSLTVSGCVFARCWSDKRVRQPRCSAVQAKWQDAVRPTLRDLMLRL